MRFHFWNCGGKKFESVLIKGISLSVDESITPWSQHSLSLTAQPAVGLLKGSSVPKYASMADPWWGLDFLCVKE